MESRQPSPAIRALPPLLDARPAASPARWRHIVSAALALTGLLVIAGAGLLVVGALGGVALPLVGRPDGYTVTLLVSLTLVASVGVLGTASVIVHGPRRNVR